MAATLEELLDQTHAALLRGDLAALSGLFPMIEGKAQTVPRNRALIERLRTKADRNMRLLQAAARGVRAAKGRLAEIAAGPVLTTYTARGHREAVAPLSDAAPKRL
jgi:hypothetical protein